MRKAASITATVVLLVLIAAPVHASVTKGRHTTWAKSLLVWIQSKISPPLPAPDEAEPSDSSQTKRTTS